MFVFAASVPRRSFIVTLLAVGFVVVACAGALAENDRGYKEIETENRANTWSTFVTFAVSPAAPEPTAKQVARK